MGDYVLCTHWWDGDVLPFIRIGEQLSKKGNSVTLLTHACYEKSADKAGIGFEAWDTPDEYKELIEDIRRYKGTFASGQEIHRFRDKHENIEKRIREAEKVRHNCKSENTVIIAKSGSVIPALVAAELQRCPIAHLFIAPYEVGSTVNFYELFSDRLNYEANAIRRAFGLDEAEDWLLWQCRPKVQLGLWPVWFYNDFNEWPAKIEPVGFPSIIRSKCSDADNRQLQSFREILKQDPSPILISGSTGTLVRDEFYHTVIAAAGDIGKKAIVVTKYRELLPEELPSNIIWMERLPFSEIMGQVSLVIHHGGIGTLSSALYAGTPQLILAYDTDRPLNASIIKRLGVGEYLPPVKWKKTIITAAINQLLAPELRKKCGDFVSSHMDFSAIDIVCARAGDMSEHPEQYRINGDKTDKNTYKNTDSVMSNFPRNEETGKHVSAEVLAYLQKVVKQRSE